MFGDSKKPIDLRSHSRWQIEHVLNRCAACGKQENAHNEASRHEYQRNKSLPEWRGWKAFRKGAASHIAKNLSGDGDKAASLALRHANPAVTINHYIDESKQRRRAKAARKELVIAEQRQIAAAVLGAGLRQAVVN
jgi:integrase